jgi:serine/threonine-protein kinase
MTSLKVLDFGISKVDAPGEHDTTKTGQMMGSPKYMAPEQMLSMHDVDARADVWSLGAILYDMLTGRTPFVADTVAQLCSAVLHDKPPPPRQFRPDLPEELETAIMTCLQRDRVDRFRDVAALAAAIAPFAPASPSPAFLLGALRRASSVPGRVDDTPTVHTPPSTTAATAPVAAPSATSAATSSVAPPSRSASLVWQDTPQQPEPTRRRFRVAAVVAMAAALGGVLVLVVLRGRARDQLVIQPALAATAPGGGEVVAALAPPTSKPDVAQPPPPPVAVTSSDAQPAPSPAPVAPSSKPVAPPSPSAGPSTRAPVKRGPAPADPRPSPDSDPFGGKRK